ncbi:MAG TPA: Rrf2 family transcriptional regulator [Acetobacteraceae bacterium]|nr:Rrf2 family transcriptional regulator [Acetobacteraceae bacterium]
MRLLASTDYALRVLMLLAAAPDGERISVDMLARTLGGLSRNHLHKIVQELTALGVTRTARGTGGGVALAVPPETVRLGSLVRQLEADQPVVECFRQDDCACTLLPACRLRGMLRAAQDSFYQNLEAFTLADCLADRALIGQP